MAASDLTIDQIYEYIKHKGGIVANRDVVRHFKRYLTDPETKDDARSKFKRYVNLLAVTKTEGDEKFLILKPKYTNGLDIPQSPPPPPSLASPQYDPRNSIGIPVSPSGSAYDITPGNSPGLRQPPPYRPPPPVISPNCDNISISSSNFSIQETSAPQVPPRRKSGDKYRNGDGDGRSIEEKHNNNKPTENNESVDKQMISVKERTQKFNRLASVEDDLSPRKEQKDKKKTDKGVDEDDGASVTSLEPKKCTEWYVIASKGNYQELVKLAKEEPRLVKRKDPFTAYTVLHWGAKHGNENIIKEFAGNYKADVNARTNGGYTPLHLAIQFGHKNVYDLLVQVYHADPNIRDFSGRLPIYYERSQVQTNSKDNYHKKGRKKQSDKDLGFLRIGSLNVRVKKTTEAFSNFLGVGSGGSISPASSFSDKVHKGWGSADNVNQENLMPAPKSYVTKRKSKRPLENSGVNSTPGTPKQTSRATYRHSAPDSDSDTAAGFDSNWHN